VPTPRNREEPINSHNNPPVNIDNYPAIKKHLDTYYLQLNQRGDKGLTPYNLRQCAYLKEFEQEKIVWADLSRSGNCFTFDDKKLYLQNTGYIMTGVSLKYLIAVLNTKLILHYFDGINQKLDNTGWRWINQYVEILPIPKILPEQQPLIDLVEKILIGKKSGANTEPLEREIDKRVYALYDLTDDEINIIEGGK
jgi:site-specific DNA-methyltransferase (adenine-specific)